MKVIAQTAALQEALTVAGSIVAARSPKPILQCIKLVAEGKTLAMQELFEQYETLLMEALRLKTTSKKNMNVLQHIMGYFKKNLSADEKQELLEVIDQYGKEYVPLIVPVTLFNHYVRKYEQAYLDRQVYLNPHPIALKLRNHVWLGLRAIYCDCRNCFSVHH